MNLSVIHRARGKLDEARAALNSAVKLAESAAHPGLQAIIYSEVATFGWQTEEDQDKVIELWRRSISAAVEDGAASLLANALVQLADILVRLGEYDLAWNEIDRAAKQLPLTVSLDAAQRIEIVRASIDARRGSASGALKRLQPLVDREPADTQRGARVRAALARLIGYHAPFTPLAIGVGWGLAVLSQAILFSWLPPDVAWRWMFAIGALPALLVFYLRRYVTEPEIAAATRAKQAASGERPALWEIFSGPILKTTLLASLMVTGCQGGYYAITFWVPRFLTVERKLSVVSSTGYLAALIIGSFAGYLVGAWLADRIGRRNLFLTFSLGAIAVVLLYTQLQLTNEVLWLLGFPLGFFASGYFSGVGAFLTELFPTRLRGSGQGFCYNFGRGIGALFPFLVGSLSTSTSLANAIAIFAVAAYGVFFIAAFALPETRGRVLHADG